MTTDSIACMDGNLYLGDFFQNVVEHIFNLVDRPMIENPRQQLDAYK
jgi:hypothetical protein